MSIKVRIGLQSSEQQANSVHSAGANHSRPRCYYCHVPYLESQVPFPTNLVPCSICHKSKVPDFLFMTIEPCENTPIIGYGTLIQARVCRTKRETKGESCAKEISDVSPLWLSENIQEDPWLSMLKHFSSLLKTFSESSISRV